jgi:hypothetical protein
MKECTPITDDLETRPTLVEFLKTIEQPNERKTYRDEAAKTSGTSVTIILITGHHPGFGECILVAAFAEAVSKKFGGINIEDVEAYGVA